MKVLHVVDKFGREGSGMHGVAHLLAGWLPVARGRGSDHQLCSLRARNSAAAAMEQLGFKIHYLNSGKFNPLAINRLLNLVRTENPDILHLHEYGAYTLGRIAAGLSGRPSVVQVHVGQGYPAPAYFRIASRMVRPWTDRVIASSEAERSFAIESLGVSPGRISMIAKGIDLGQVPALSAQARREELHRKGLSENSLVIGSVGRLDELKGHRYLLEAMVGILREIPAAVCVLVGDGPERESLERQAARLGLREKVRFAGYLGKKDRSLWQALFDVHAMPSLSEGTPLSAFEAMGAGIPQVVSRVGGLEEIIRDGETGYFVAPGDVGSIGKKLIGLLKNSSERIRIGRNARESSRAYDINLMVDKIEALYNSLSPSGNGMKDGRNSTRSQNRKERTASAAGSL